MTLGEVLLVVSIDVLYNARSMPPLDFCCITYLFLIAPYPPNMHLSFNELK